MNETYYTTIGMDVSDRKTQVCVMTKTGTTPKVQFQERKRRKGNDCNLIRKKLECPVRR